MKCVTNSLASTCHRASPLSTAIRQISSCGCVRRVVGLAFGVALSAFSSAAFALGLGELQSQSYLGQPLNAKVSLVNINSDLDINYVLVRTVGADEAQRMGADVYHGVHLLDVKLVESAEGIEVAVTTDVPVKEPYMSVLLELRWPSGVVYREYPILLDPAPIVAAPKSVPAPKSVNLNANRNQASTRSLPEAQAVDRRNITLKALDTKEGKYKVRSGDSLSKISARWSEGTSQSLQETNEWLFKNNPHAFSKNSMDHLIAGAVLVMPDLSTLQVSDKGTDGRHIESASATQLPSQTTIGTVTPGTATEAASKNASATDVAMAEQVKGLLTVGSQSLDDKSRELIDMLSRENEMLKSRMEKLESSEYLTTMRELVVLQQEQIKELQARLGDKGSLEPKVQAMFESADIDAPLVVGGVNKEGDTQATPANKQELLQELDKNKAAVAVIDAEKTANAIIELEPNGIEVVVEKGNENRSRLIAILFIAGGILSAIFAAMFFYYRKMVAGRPAEAGDLPPLRTGKVEPSLSSVTQVRTAKVKNEAKPSIDYDLHLEQHEEITSKEADAWYGEKVTLEEHDKELNAAFDDVNQEFAGLELDEGLLGVPNDDVAESSLEALTQEMPEVKKPRRSDEEVRSSIAEKMAQYSVDDANESEALTSLELDELEDLDGASYDDVDTIIYRAMMYCEFKKYDKARHLVEVKIETDDDVRLMEALAQIDALQVEAEKKDAS